MTNGTTQTNTDVNTPQSGSMKEQVADKAGEVTSVAKQEAVDVVHDAKRQARRLAEDSRDQLRRQADQQAQRLAQTVRDVGRQLHDMANGKAPPTGMVSDVTQQVASSAHHAADALDQRGFDGVVSDVKQFARRRPGVFIAGALGAGVIVGRLLRSMDTSAVVEAAKPSGQPGGESGNGQPLVPPPAVAPPGPGIIGPQPSDPRTEI